MRRLLLPAVLFVNALCLFSPVLAETVPISGVVVGPEGQPLVGAEVWVLGHERDPAKGWKTKDLGLHATTDEQGRFSFLAVELLSLLASQEFGPWTETAVIACKPPYALGWRSVWTARDNLTIKCRRAEPVVGKVTTQDGRGLAARVELGAIYMEGFDQEAQTLALSEDLGRRLGVTCAADGSFTLGLVPQGRGAMVRVSMEGYAPGREASAEPGQPLKIVLEPPGRVEITVTCPEAGQVGGLRGYCGAGGVGEYFTTDEQGRASVELPPGKGYVYMYAWDRLWQAERNAEIAIKLGETTRVEIPLRRAAQVTGRVVDAATGEPVAGAGIAGGQYGSAATHTDQEGNYTLNLLPGKREVSLVETPDGLTVSSYSSWRLRTVTVTEMGATVETIQLPKTVTLQGVTVDPAGKPVPGAEVYSTQWYYRPVAISDADGKFALQHPAPDHGTSLWARTENFVTPQTTEIERSKLTAPVKLTLVPALPVRLEVTVTDQDGQPVSEAQVGVTWREWHTQKRAGKTDAAGAWISDDFLPMGSYSLQVSAPQCSTARTEPWTPVPGQTHDFGVLKLTRATGVIAGRVLDASGKPVSGAKVWNAGEGVARVEAVTEAEGRFRLVGLLPGEAFVFAEAAGCEFTGACYPVGTQEATIIVSPRPEVAALGEPQPLPGVTDADRQGAKELLQLALTLPDGGGNTRKALVGLLALVDLAQAQTLSAQANGAFNDEIAHKVGMDLLATAPEEGLKWLAQVGEPQKQVAGQAVATVKLARLHPDLARRQLDHAVPMVQTMDKPYEQAMYLALMARAMWDVDRALAQPVLDRAVKLAEGLARQGVGAVGRMAVANVLAQSDPDAALELASNLRGYEDDRDEFTGLLAIAVAATAPERAQQLLEALPEYNQTEGLTLAAGKMAPADPERAIELARKARDNEAAPALLQVAEALRPVDAAKSWEVYQEALGRLQCPPREEGAPPPMESYEYTQLARRYARAALVGKLIGYPLSRELAWRALDALGSAAVTAEASPYQDVFSLEQVLNLLALAEPELAFEAARVRTRRLPPASNPQYDNTGRLLVCLAASNPPQAAATLRALQEQSEQWRKLSGYYYERAAAVMLAGPEERRHRLLREGRGWLEAMEWEW